MARTSKTKVGGGPRQDTMMRAAEQGHQAMARGEQDKSAARSESVQAGLQMGSDMARTAGAYDQRQHAEAMTQQQQDFQGKQNALDRSSREGVAREQMDLRAAEQGLQRNPELEARQAKLDAEMKRGEAQMSAPSEMVGPRFVPTERKLEEQQQSDELNRFKADTERMRAKAYLQQVQGTAVKAQSSGDKEAYRTAKADFAGRVGKYNSLADRVIKSSMGDPKANITGDDIARVRQLVGDNPSPELQAEIESGQLGPHTSRFLKGLVIFDSLPFVIATGDWPDQELVDESHPKYQEFQSKVVQAGELMKQQQQFGGMMGIQSLNDAYRRRRRAAAAAMMAEENARRMRASERMNTGQPASSPAPPPAMLPAQAPQLPGAVQPHQMSPGQTGGPVSQPGGWENQR